MSRPRSARAHKDVLDAALKLFAERGVDATSMDAIAETSGVSKATIYKHWPDKDALCLEVMTLGRRAPSDLDSGDLRADLVAALGPPPPPMSDVRLRMMPYLMAYAARNPAFGKAWQASVMDPIRQTLTRVLQRGIRDGQLRRALDIDLAITLLQGPIMYAHVLERLGRKVPQNLAEGVVDAFLSSSAACSPGRTRVRPRP